MTRCPSSAQLGQWLADDLAGAEAAAVETHIETCAGCQQTLEQLTRKLDVCRGQGPASHGESGGHFLLRLEQGLLSPGGEADLVPHSQASAPPLGTTRDHLTAPMVH